uniref:Uncharacterized protein n=1 Tax=Photinus pyralis TaxID=7054 RepID=A0A1Y1KF69_PHOPY
MSLKSVGSIFVNINACSSQTLIPIMVEVKIGNKIIGGFASQPDTEAQASVAGVNFLKWIQQRHQFDIYPLTINQTTVSNQEEKLNWINSLPDNPSRRTICGSMVERWAIKPEVGCSNLD